MTEIQHKNPVTSVRLPEPTRNQINELTAQWGCSMANVITIAIDRMYHQENTNMNTQLPTVTVEAWLTKYGELTIRHNGKVTTLSKQHDITAMLADLKVTDTQTDKVQEGFAVRAEMPAEHIDRLTWWTA